MEMGGSKRARSTHTGSDDKYVAWAHKRSPPPGQGSSTIENLKLLLENQDGHKLFMDFLVHEHAAENLQFWDAVNKFERTDVAQLKILAQTISDTYVQEGARLQVNIKSSQVLAVHTALASQSVDNRIFADAKNTVFEVMRTDKFPAFARKYPLWQEYIGRVSGGGLAQLRDEIVASERRSGRRDLVARRMFNALQT
jgi:hypothetical protein